MYRNTTTRVLSAFLILGWAGCGPAEESSPVPESPPVPKIVCDEPVHEFGEVENSQIIEHDFTIRNAGGATLEILKAKPSCGCTVANISSKVVEPGETAIISAKLNLRGREGKQHKSISVESNDPKTKNLSLLLRGNAVSLVSVSPRTIMVPKMIQGEITTNTIRIVSREEGALEVTVGTTGSPHVEARVVPVEGTNAVDVVVTTKASLPKGATFGRVTLNTNCKSRPAVNVAFRYSVVGEISVYPTELAMVAQDKPLTRILTVGPGIVQEFAIEGVEVPADSKIVAKVQDLKNSRYRIVLSEIIPGKDLDGKVLRILTTAENMEVVEVPFKIISRK